VTTVHLIEGPVGVGKSTFAIKLCRQKSAIWFNLDDWMANLFAPDRPRIGRIEWYLERKERCINHIWKLASSILALKVDVVLELGLIRREDRERFYSLVDESGLNLVIYVLDAPVSVRRDRVKLRNLQRGDTFAMEVSDDIFELANNLWEPMTDKETLKYPVNLISHEDF